MADRSETPNNPTSSHHPTSSQHPTSFQHPTSSHHPTSSLPPKRANEEHPESTGKRLKSLHEFRPDENFKAIFDKLHSLLQPSCDDDDDDEVGSPVDGDEWNNALQLELDRFEKEEMAMEAEFDKNIAIIEKALRNQALERDTGLPGPHTQPHSEVTSSASQPHTEATSSASQPPRSSEYEGHDLPWVLYDGAEDRRLPFDILSELDRKSVLESFHDNLLKFKDNIKHFNMRMRVGRRQDTVNQGHCLFQRVKFHGKLVASDKNSTTVCSKCANRVRCPCVRLVKMGDIFAFCMFPRQEFSSLPNENIEKWMKMR